MWSKTGFVVTRTWKCRRLVYADSSPFGKIILAQLGFSVIVSIRFMINLRVVVICRVCQVSFMFMTCTQGQK